MQQQPKPSGPVAPARPHSWVWTTNVLIHCVGVGTRTRYSLNTTECYHIPYTNGLLIHFGRGYLLTTTSCTVSTFGTDYAEDYADIRAEHPYTPVRPTGERNTLSYPFLRAYARTSLPQRRRGVLCWVTCTHVWSSPRRTRISLQEHTVWESLTDLHAYDLEFSIICYYSISLTHCTTPLQNYMYHMEFTAGSIFICRVNCMEIRSGLACLHPNPRRISVRGYSAEQQQN